MDNKMSNKHKLMNCSMDPDDVMEMETKFCLCQRSPDSPEVREDLLKSLALGFRYGIVQGGCIKDIAVSFDKIMSRVVPDEAQILMQMIEELDSEVKIFSTEIFPKSNARPKGVMLH